MTAFANYDKNINDPKSAVNFNPVKQVGVVSIQPTAFVRYTHTNQPQDGILTTLQLYYNGPTPPPGVFDEFLAIPQTSNNVKTRTLLDVVSSLKFPPIKRYAPLIDTLVMLADSCLRSIVDHVPLNRFPLELVKAYLKEVEVSKLLPPNNRVAKSHYP